MEKMSYHNKLLRKIKELKENVADIYIYGAGFYGKDVYRFMKRSNIEIGGFLVTKNIIEDTCLEQPVYLASNKIEENIGIIVAMTPIYAQEVKTYLLENSFDMNKVIFYGAFDENGSGRGNYQNESFLEITTIIGCKVNCKFCPQSKLLDEYYKFDKNRKRLLEVADLEKIIANIEEERILMFAGFGEPFLNPCCMELLKIACKSKHKVHFFTTLVGASVDDVKELVNYPIEFCTLHVADKYGYANIPTDSEYYEKLKILVDAKKENGMPFVDYVNAQDEVSDEIYDIFKNKYEIMTSVHDRAGNIESDKTEHIKVSINKKDKITCQCVGDALDSNVVLPDGTLVLCNSDYGMQHVLGNLAKENIWQIREGNAFKEILKAFKGESDMDLLCRNCTNARKISD